MQRIFLALAGGAAGAINGLFGGGGGMVLVPALGARTGIQEQNKFSVSVAIIVPVCIVSLIFSYPWGISFKQVLPYLFGSAIGGTAAGFWGRCIPTIWLHRFLGLLILWGGIRYLW